VVVKMGLNVKIKKKLPGFEIDVSFACPDSGLIALLGPSGSGKTTIIRTIAGLERPDRGRITYNDTVWVDTEQGIFLPPQKRALGYVFQEYTLFPHLNLEENVSFAAKNKSRVDELLRLFGILHLRKRKVQQLSGGERQRTALAQALARDPDVLLLDEPFSALDVVTRKKLREELNDLKKQLSLPIIHVTHDLEEAEFLADEVFPIEQGKPAVGWLDTYLTGTVEVPTQSEEHLTHNRSSSEISRKRYVRFEKLRRFQHVYSPV
jgi:molybdate transport system ATP-binding protein